MMVVLGDLTRASAGSLQSVARRLPYLSNTAHEYCIVLHPSQRHEIAPIEGAFEVIEIAEGDVGEQILEIVRSKLTEANTVVVFTFSGFVLTSAHRLSQNEQQRVSFKRWADVYALASEAPAATQGGIGPWPLTTITVDEALAVLRRVLASAPGGVRKTNLRALVSREGSGDPRLSSTANPQVSGLMTILIAEAEKVGLVRLDRTSNPQNPFIHLSDTPPPSQHSRNLLADVSPSLSKDEQYRSALRKAGMGPFPNFRDDLYAALEGLVASGPTVGALIVKSVKSLEGKHDGHDKFSFGPVQSFLTSLLKRRPVLLGAAGETLTAGFASLDATVASLLPEWKSHLDGELVLCILREGCEISFFDIPALTGTIYPTRDEQFQERAQRLISFLKQSGRISYKADDSIQINEVASVHHP